MPRYYQYGYQGPQYAGLWKNQLPTLQTQAPGLRYGLGDAGSDAFALAAAADLSKLSDDELDVIIVFYQEGIALTPPKERLKLAPALAILSGLEKERDRRERNKLLLFGGGAVVVLYVLFGRKR